MNLIETAYQISNMKHNVDLTTIDEELLADTLECLEGTMQEKIEYLTDKILEMNRFSEIIKLEEQRLYDRRKSMEKRVDNIKQYIQNCMTVAGMNKINYALFTVSVQNNPPSVSVFDETAIPSNWFVEKIERKADKKAILEALKAGESIPGCGIERSQSLRIK